MKQTVLSDYFRGTVKSTPTPNAKLIKKRRSCFRRFESVKSTSGESVTNLSNFEVEMMSCSQINASQGRKIRSPKRKLVAPILSEDEDGDIENSPEGVIDKDKSGKVLMFSPSKKPLVKVAINKPKPLSLSPAKQWTATQTCSAEISTEISTPSWPGVTEKRQSSVYPSTSQTTANNNTILTDFLEMSDAERAQRLIEKIANSESSTDDEFEIPEITPRRRNRLVATPDVSPNKQREVKKQLVFTTNAQIKDEDGDSKVNYYYVDVLKKFFYHIQENDINYLMSKDDLNLLNEFFTMPINYQYVCMKLFVRKVYWRNVFKFVKSLNLNMDDKTAIYPMYRYLSEHQFVYDNYINDDLASIMKQIEVKDLRDLARSFKIKLQGASNKTIIIQKLINLCSKQSTLSQKSTTDFLKERIHQIMGFCIKISQELQDCLFKIFLLNTFTESPIKRPEEYFSNEFLRNICFPDFKIEKYQIFHTEHEFAQFANAVKLSFDLERALEKKDENEIFEICVEAFARFEQLIIKGVRVYPNRPKHLEKYSAIAKYYSIILHGAVKITPKFYNRVEHWLTYLLSVDVCLWKRSAIYSQLSLIYNTYEKDHIKSAEILIKAFEQEELSERRQHELAYRCKVLKKKSYNLPQLYHDQFTTLEPPSCDRDYPVTVIKKTCVRANQSGFKRKYVIHEEDGSKKFVDVEDVALYHYRENGYPRGIHCEGSLILSLFNILFWDIIYDSHVEGVFVSKFQITPLDMYTKYFYINRESAIKKRIDQIYLLMKDGTLKRFLERNFNNHSHESSLINVDGFMANFGLAGPEELWEIVTCIGRGVLAKIFQRLVVNLRENQSGMPDLFIWDAENKNCKFVEVKSDNDKLSICQKLWLNYLMDIGAEVEVCHVLAASSRKKVAAAKN